MVSQSRHPEARRERNCGAWPIWRWKRGRGEQLWSLIEFCAPPCVFGVTGISLGSEWPAAKVSRMKNDRVSYSNSRALTRRNMLRTLALSVGAAGMPGWLIERNLFAADPAAPPAFVSTPVGEGLTLITGAV